MSELSPVYFESQIEELHRKIRSLRITIILVIVCMAVLFVSYWIFRFSIIGSLRQIINSLCQLTDSIRQLLNFVG